MVSSYTTEAARTVSICSGDSRQLLEAQLKQDSKTHGFNVSIMAEEMSVGLIPTYTTISPAQILTASTNWAAATTADSQYLL